ncbi:MAG: cupin domain-containing protein [Candidatus Binataceae bacterium]
MEYIEKITWEGRSLSLKRTVKPTDVAGAQSNDVALERLTITDPAVRPANQDLPEGVPLRVFSADGVGVDVSKRSREEMNYWHRNADYDELIFCHQGGMIWETELGTVEIKAGDMLLIPRGVAHRAIPPKNSGENVLVELKIRPSVRKVWPSVAKAGA